MSVRRLVLLAARIIAGGTFILASLDKIAHPGLFAGIVQGYRILPQIVILPFSYALPWFELILGIFLIVGLFPNRSAFVAAILVTVFIAAITIRAIQGPISDCGCFSVSRETGNQGVLILLLRDIILLALCVLNIFPNILMPDRAGRTL